MFDQPMGLVLLGLVLVTGTVTAYRRFEVAAPNEWLLVIVNGELRKAGIGLRAFRLPGHQVVRFPSSIQKVQFKAQQVTREMQGIEVSGFVIWVVFREDEGPFKAYKYLEGLAQSGQSPQANENIARMAESIIRHRVANSTISEVITNRAALRDQVRSEMLEVVKGWGVWLETVEITDVMVLSSSLFEDLQAPYRQETHREAESVRLKTRQAIAEEQLESETELANQKAEASTQRAVFLARQELAQAREEGELFAKRLELEADRLRQKHELARLCSEQELEIKRVQAEAEIEIAMRRLELEAGMTPTNLQKATLDAIQEIYRQLPIETVKLVNVGEGVEGLVGKLLTAVRGAGAE